jgi:hypothetical protein
MVLAHMARSCVVFLSSLLGMLPLQPIDHPQR